MSALMADRISPSRSLIMRSRAFSCWILNSTARDRPEPKAALARSTVCFTSAMAPDAAERKATSKHRSAQRGSEPRTRFPRVSGAFKSSTGDRPLPPFRSEFRSRRRLSRAERNRAGANGARAQTATSAGQPGAKTQWSKEQVLTRGPRTPGEEREGRRASGGCGQAETRSGFKAGRCPAPGSEPSRGREGRGQDWGWSRGPRLPAFLQLFFYIFSYTDLHLFAKQQSPKKQTKKKWTQKAQPP